MSLRVGLYIATTTLLVALIAGALAFAPSAPNATTTDKADVATKSSALRPFLISEAKADTSYGGTRPPYRCTAWRDGDRWRNKYGVWRECTWRSGTGWGWYRTDFGGGGFGGGDFGGGGF